MTRDMDRGGVRAGGVSEGKEEETKSNIKMRMRKGETPGKEMRKTTTGGFFLVNAMSHFQTQSCLCSNYKTYINEIWCGLLFYYVEENHSSDFLYLSPNSSYGSP